MSDGSSEEITEDLPPLSEIEFDEIEYSEPISILSDKEIQEIEDEEPITREELAKLFRGERYTVKQIQEITGLSKNSINRLLSKYQIYKNEYKYLEKATPQQLFNSFNNEDDE